MSFGIDFGTTNSAVVLNGNELIGGATVPTAVAISHSSGKILYGQEVRRDRQQLLEAGNWQVITSIKSSLDDPRQTWDIAGRTESPQTIATYFLEHLIDYVNVEHGQAMTEAVVSIPVGFRSLQAPSP